MAVFNWAVPLCALLVVLIGVDIFSSASEKHVLLWVFLGKGQSVNKSEGYRDPSVFLHVTLQKDGRQLNLSEVNTEVMCKMLSSLFTADCIPLIDLVYLQCRKFLPCFQVELPVLWSCFIYNAFFSHCLLIYVVEPSINLVMNYSILNLEGHIYCLPTVKKSSIQAVIQLLSNLPFSRTGL